MDTRDYLQYYIGNKDDESRKHGKGENHWSGVKSLEWYEGHFVRDTMHGIGDYSCRFRGPEKAIENAVTYEGYFYCNQFHGYGTMSYPNGKTFTGLFLSNVRWGPGVENQADMHDNVGLWRGSQLVRLAWRPSAPNIVPDFMSISSGRTLVESHRIILTSKVETVGEVNSAIELLKRCGADPRVAVERWKKVYPKNCSDIRSPLCHIDFLNHNYYDGKICTLNEKDESSDNKDLRDDETETYYVWSNNSMMINMMKHSYKHEKQRNPLIFDLTSVLSGPRIQFKPAGSQELLCRTLLMACYLGYIAEVAKLINGKKINPDVCDIQGNSAIMYAVCGDHPDIINFLVEAGANVDYYNDNCCSPLAVALMRYTCARNDIVSNGMLYAMLPPAATPAPPPVEQKVFEWNIIRDPLSTSAGGTLTKIPSKIARNMSSKKIKSLLSIKDQSPIKKKTDPQPKILDPEDDPFSEELRLYNDVSREYCIKVTDSFILPNGANAISYLFDVNDMVKEIEANEEDQRKAEKVPKKVSSKVIKETMKTSKEAMWDTNEKEKVSIDSAEKLKIDMLSKIMFTILQLLSDGADPKSVQFPQPALFIAVTSNCPDLLRRLVQYGANINESYPQVFDYTCLDVVVSRPITQTNFEMINVLLENGADVNHRPVYTQETKDPTNSHVTLYGPTLLHVVITKKTDNNNEEDIRRQLLELLLEHNCDPIVQFKGRSAIDLAMNKNLDLFNAFIKHPKVNLNAIINDANQSILVKLFSMSYFRSMTGAERLQTLTNLLLFGADPLIECQNDESVYQNIFIYTKQNLNEVDNNTQKQDSKSKKPDKTKKDDKLSTKSMGKMTSDEVDDYKQATGLMTDCARLIYIRWLQAKLMKELIVVINKYRHRQWNMIIKELNTNIYGLWLAPQRCLEMWDILSSTKKKIYNDKRVLRHLLCMPLSENKVSCSWCKLISFCSIECIKMNINRKECHPCNDYIKQKYFSNFDEDNTNTGA
ncbi:ankyrin repeat and MYND domain-containing protein 1-like [Vanessa atalanta]|uniref:ankyrin repeat and MYND domain-containing protein 1-like n=1 Tax=Vanessa atalanta TaxID=42275 RepID=UPI001FCE264A|nr:ankyrin repeat and MYND domain-containing protein 1-like [Vanessa atalanta]